MGGRRVLKQRATLTLVAVLLAGPAAAGLPGVTAGTHAQECTLTVAGVPRSCENYFYSGDV